LGNWCRRCSVISVFSRCRLRPDSNPLKASRAGRAYLRFVVCNRSCGSGLARESVSTGTRVARSSWVIHLFVIQPFRLATFPLHSLIKRHLQMLRFAFFRPSRASQPSPNPAYRNALSTRVPLVGTVRFDR
jgi:hypothetical protein